VYEIKENHSSRVWKIDFSNNAKAEEDTSSRWSLLESDNTS
jgi:hypothetical protein